jgi:hypothetical protein
MLDVTSGIDTALDFYKTKLGYRDQGVLLLKISTPLTAIKERLHPGLIHALTRNGVGSALSAPFTEWRLQPGVHGPQ